MLNNGHRELIIVQLISFTFYRLCMHPEHIGPLREEAERFCGDTHDTNNEDMPLLDSFLREVARMHPITVGEGFYPLHILLRENTS